MLFAIKIVLHLTFLPFSKAADSFANPDEINDGFVITRAVLITMSVAFTYIVFVVVLMMWCRHKRRSRKLLRITDDTHKDNVDCEEGVVNGGDKHDETEPCLPGDKVANGTKKKGSTANEQQEKSDDTANSNKSKKSSTSVLDQWALPRKSLENLILIGKGDFGDVFIGKIKQNSLLKDKILEESLADEQKPNGDLTKLNGGLEMKQRKQQSSEELNEIKSENDNRLILIKALNKVKDESACSEFRRQLDLFRLVSSRNVTKLYGLCREKDPHYLVLEYTDWGDLKQFLLATTASSTASIENTNINKNGVKTPALKIPQILALAHQVIFNLHYPLYSLLYFFFHL
jgi:PTK7 protein tyrosine kinase 7